MVFAVILFISCSNAPSGTTLVDIKNAEYKEGNVLLTLKTNEAAKNARIDVVNKDGQILCSKYKDLAAGTNQFELTDWRVEKEIKISVSAPGQPVIIEDFKLKMPTPNAKIESAKYELTNLVLTFNANLDISNARIEVVSEGNVLCTKYSNLKQGTNEFKFNDCGNKGKITVSLTPPGGTLVTKDFKMELPLVNIQSVIYDLSTLVLTFDANAEMKNTRVDVIKNGNVLCTKYIDLIQGQNQKRFDDCGVEEKLTISVTPEGGLLSTKEFTLNPPILKFQEGYRYDYTFVSSAGSTPKYTSIYVTKETPEVWEGIAGVKEVQAASLIRFKISKNDLTLTTTNTLKENEILSSNLEYKSPWGSSINGNDGLMIPFWFPLFKEKGLNVDELLKNKVTSFSIPPSSEFLTYKLQGTLIKNNFVAYDILVTANQQGQTKTFVELYALTSKPYILISATAPTQGGGLLFEGLQKKDFTLSDYAGYQIRDYVGGTVPVNQAVPVEKRAVERQPAPEQVPTQ